jgi:tRNA threonylcarbamoyladenosine biosynthesis protein TsaB
MITLAMDASTYAGSVCVTRGLSIIAASNVAMRSADRDNLMPAVVATLAKAGVELDGVDRIVCGDGPGSFTSLRIAAAIAKGLAMTAGKPLFAVSSLALMVGAVQPPLPAGEYLAVLDALRGEYYAATCAVGADGDIADVSRVRIVQGDDVDALDEPTRPLVGAGRRIRGAPDARGVARADRLLARDGPVDLAAWEPGYGRVAEAQRRWEAAHGRAMPRA